MLHNNIPYFTEGEKVIFCSKKLAVSMLEESYWDKSIVSDFHPEKDFHTIYYGEITDIFEKNK